MVRFEDLPSDILHIIFAATIPERPLMGFSQIQPISSPLRISMNISHVCRRIRRIALDTPALWSTLSNLLIPADAIREIIQRARDPGVGLTVTISLGAGRQPRELEPFIRAVAPYAYNWTRLQITLSQPLPIIRTLFLPKTPRNTETQDDVDNISPIIDFPRLTTLECLFHPSSAYDRAHISHWRVPNLRRFFGLNMLPPPSALSSIDEISLLFTDGVFEPLNPIELLLFLEGLPKYSCLTALSLVFLNWPAQNIRFTLSSQAPYMALSVSPVYLPRLQHLSFSMITNPSYIAWQVFARIQSPQLASLRVAYKGWLALTIPDIVNICASKKPQTLELHCSTAMIDPPQEHDVYDILSKMPWLRSFELHSCYLYPAPGRSLLTVSTELERLKFKDCVGLNVEELTSFVRGLQEGGHAMHLLRSVEVVDCGGLSEEMLQTLKDTAPRVVTYTLSDPRDILFD